MDKKKKTSIYTRRAQDNRVKQLPLPRELQLEIRDQLPPLRIAPIPPERMGYFDFSREMDREISNYSNEEELWRVQRMVDFPARLRNIQRDINVERPDLPRHVRSNNEFEPGWQSHLPTQDIYSKFNQMFPPASK